MVGCYREEVVATIIIAEMYDIKNKFMLLKEERKNNLGSSTT